VLLGDDGGHRRRQVLVDALGVDGVELEVVGLDGVQVAHEDEAVERLAKVDLEELEQCPGHDLLSIGLAPFFTRGQQTNLLVIGPETRNTDGDEMPRTGLLLALVLDLEELLDALVDGHVPRRLVDLLALDHVLDRLLLDLDVDQAQRVQPDALVLDDLVVKAVWPPRLGEERDRHRLAVVVQLQPAAPDGVHDGRVVHRLDDDAQLAGPEDEVGVRGGPSTQ